MPATRRKRATSSEESPNQATETTEATTQTGEQTATPAQEVITPGDASDTHGANGANVTISTSDVVSIPDHASSPRPASTERASRLKERTHTRRVRREEPSQAAQASQTETSVQKTEPTPSAPSASLSPSIQPTQQFQQPLPSQQQPSHTFQNSTAPTEQQTHISSVSSSSQASLPTSSPERERPERADYAPTIEPGRRTARGELFRRPPQIPPQHSGQNQQGGQSLSSQTTPPAPVQSTPNHAHVTHTPPTPTHEINLPLGNLLHLAYNPGYTGSEEARSTLLHKLASESKAGGRARCWNCGSLAVVYDRWNTRSKTFGEVGVAICEVCGAWSVL